MPVATLSRLTVPVSGDSGGLLMPKLKYRFRVLLEGFGGVESKELTKQVMTCTRPEVTMENVVIDVYNSQIKLAGKPKWSDITLVVRDDSSGEIQRLVGQQLQKQFDFFEQSSAVAGIDYKFTTRIEILDGGNGAAVQILEAFVLEGCFINKATYQGGDYKSNDPLDVSMTLAYDNATQYSAEDNLMGVGMTVPRDSGTLSTG